MLPPPIPNQQIRRDPLHSGIGGGRRTHPSAEATVEISEKGAFCKPFKVETGLFSGRWMRFSLSVAQEPVLGRRKTEKDRRPLGPCPIIRFRAIECRRRGGGSNRGPPTDEWDEQEVDPSAIEPTNLVCAAQLRSPSEYVADGSGISRAARPLSEISSRQSSTSNSYSMASMALDDPSDADGDGRMQIGADDGSPAVSSLMGIGRLSAVDDTGVAGPGPASARHRASTAVEDLLPESFFPLDGRYPRGAQQPRDEDDFSSIPRPNISGPLNAGNRNILPDGESDSPPPRREEKRPRLDRSSGATRNLYGCLHVPAVRVSSMEGGVGTWFLFTDLSVRQEGSYTLRFQCYDMTAVEMLGSAPAAALIECQSQTFRVYSPRQVPPLPKPTALAEHFAQQGFKLNTRKNERTESSPPPASGEDDQSERRLIQPSEPVESSDRPFTTIVPAQSQYQTLSQASLEKTGGDGVQEDNIDN